MDGIDAPENMFEVSECIDKLDDQIRKLKLENKKLKEQLANVDNTSDSGLHLQRVSFSLPTKEKLDTLMNETMKKLPSDTARKWASIGFEAGVQVFIGNES